MHHVICYLDSLHDIQLIKDGFSSFMSVPLLSGVSKAFGAELEHLNFPCA